MDENVNCNELNSMSYKEKYKKVLEIVSKLSDEQIDVFLTVYSTKQLKQVDLTTNEFCDFFRTRAKDMSRTELSAYMVQKGYKLSVIPQAVFIAHHKPELAEVLIAEYLRAMTPEQYDAFRIYIKNTEQDLL